MATIFKRLNKNSNLFIGSAAETINKINDIEKDSLILQICSLNEMLPPTADQKDCIIEYVSKQFEEDDNSVDIDFENYLETIINKDPFGGKWSGKKIREVFESGDKEWVSKALKEMRNDFIRERLLYIIGRGGYGKIIY